MSIGFTISLRDFKAWRICKPKLEETAMIGPDPTRHGVSLPQQEVPVQDRAHSFGPSTCASKVSDTSLASRQRWPRR